MWNAANAGTRPIRGRHNPESGRGCLGLNCVVEPAVQPAGRLLPEQNRELLVQHDFRQTSRVRQSVHSVRRAGRGIVVKVETEAPAQWRKLSATATPPTLDKRADSRLY